MRSASVRPDEVTGIVLCGGQGRRLGGVDKPLLRLGRKCLLEHVIDRLAPQVSRIVLSVGANADDFSSFGCELVADEDLGEGPLAGLVSAFRAVTTPWALTLPGDAPWTSPKLASRLAEDAVKNGVAVAHDGQRRQNLTLLIDRGRRADLTAFYRKGGRAVHRWFAEIALPSTDLSDIAASFFNINTPADLAAHCNSTHDSQ